MKTTKNWALLGIGFVAGLALAGYTMVSHEAQAAEAKKSAEQRLTEVEDKEQIRELLSRYMHYLDGRDMVKYSELFTEDGVVNAAQGKWTGRTEMQNMFKPRKNPDGTERAAGPPRPMLHYVIDSVIQVNGNEARHWAKYFAFFPPEKQGERPTVSGLGGYDDWLVKKDGVWYFKRRDILHENPKIQF
jgi:hypothetical protein